MIWSAESYVFDGLSYALFIGTIIALAVAATVWKRRATPGATFLTLLELATATWTFTSAFEVASTTVPLKLFWSQVSYLGINSCPPLYYLFISSYGQRTQRPRNVELVLLSIVPVMTIIMAATNPAHGLVWSDITMQPDTHLAVYAHGPWFYVLAAYSYVLLASGMVQLIIAIAHTRSLFRAQAAILLAASLGPILGNVLYIFDVNPLPGMDWTPIGFVFSGLLLAVGVVGFRILDLMPVARAKLLDAVNDAVLVVNADGRVADLNDAMRELISLRDREAIGRSAEELLAPMPELAEALQREDGEYDLALADALVSRRYYDIHLSSLRDRSGHFEGRLLVAHDSTQEIMSENERQKLAEELQRAVEQLRALTGLLPMCPMCKKIRDDHGYWHTVETYVRAHSEADFTHGICPDCMHRLYPELEDASESVTDSSQ